MISPVIHEWKEGYAYRYCRQSQYGELCRRSGDCVGNNGDGTYSPDVMSGTLPALHCDLDADNGVVFNVCELDPAMTSTNTGGLAIKGSAAAAAQLGASVAPLPAALTALFSSR